MKIIFLGLPDNPVLDFLRKDGNQVDQTMQALSAEELKPQGYEFLVSYRYRLILKPDVLALFPDRAVNLHPSLLPWNRGTFANFWSFLEGTPKGVTIHYLDEKVDTGEIIAQKRLRLSEQEGTLRTTYDKVYGELMQLFYDNWGSIKTGNCARQKQSSGGTLHRMKEMEAHDQLLNKAGWDTPVSEVVAYGKQYGYYKCADEPEQDIAESQA